MAGKSTVPDTGHVIQGKNGQYKIINEVGRGGNGIVFSVDILDNRGIPKQQNGYAIKVFKIDQKTDSDAYYKKRFSRFRREIKTVLSIQDKVKYIVPIYDSSEFFDESQNFSWYLMPKARPFNPQYCSFEQKLEYMLLVGECIQELHSMGLVHRDIKPSNLLFLNKQLYLADFGLIWDINGTDEHITEVSDSLGPFLIRPPELQVIEDINGLDYRKSDVYLFAKTLWMILKSDNRGFPSEYSRSDDIIYI